MSMVQCPNGHFYNSANGNCPHCGGQALQQQGKTVGINPNQFANQGGGNRVSPPNQFGGAQIPLPNKFGQVTPNQTPPNNPNFQPPFNQVPNGNTPNQGFNLNVLPNIPVQTPADEGKTVGMYVKNQGIDPVVGWLVCINGKDRGKDYKIRAGRNSVGRSENNDIQISGDPSISRENHATIVFDPKKNQFRVIAGDGRGIVYLNGESVDLVSELKERDQIEIGETMLLFIPLCTDKFSWEESNDIK